MAASGAAAFDLVRRILPDEGPAGIAVSDGSLRHAVQSRVQAQSRVREAVFRACAAARKLACTEAFDTITAAVCMDIKSNRKRQSCPQGGEGFRAAPMTALLVHLTAAAASGDRADAFDDVCSAAQRAIQNMADEDPVQDNSTLEDCERGAAGRICILQAAYHGAVPLAVSALEECWAESPVQQTVVVAFEDADRFPEDALRDIVHICGMVHKDASRRVCIVLIFGLSISAEPVNSALGASESAAIAPVTVHMPSAELCFHVIVEHVFASKAFPIILSRPVFFLLRRHFMENTSSVCMLEQILADIYSMHFFDQPLAALTTIETLFPDFLIDDDCGDLESGDQNERRGHCREGFYDAMDAQMAHEFISARLMPSVSKHLPESMIEVAEDALRYCGSEIARRRTPEPLNELDRAAISELAFEWHSRLCEWRWILFLVRNVLWDIAQVLNITELEMREAVWGDDRDTLNQYRFLNMKTLLFEELLPDGTQAQLSQEQDPAYPNLKNQSRQPFIRLMYGKLKGLNMAQLRQLVSTWMRSLERPPNSTLVEPASEALRSLKSDLKQFEQSIALADIECLLNTDRPVQVIRKDAAKQQEDPRPVESNNGTDEPLRKKRKGTVDSAMEELESGGRERGTRRARGSEAAREKRFRDLKAIVPDDIPREPQAQARGRLEGLFLQLLDLSKPLQSLPMHETILFSDAEKLAAFSTGVGGSAEPRDSFLHAMRGFRDDLGDIPAARIPAIAQAYEILAEGGRMINLSEWYHAFDAIRLCVKSRTASGSAHHRDDEITARSDAANGEGLSFELTTRAQFARAVSELEFLGVLKHTNRKTDHVIRLLYE